MKNKRKAFESFNKVGNVSSKITKRIKALALRSEAVQLVEMNKLDDAKISLMYSLTLEPKNENAINELFIIEELEKGNREISELKTVTKVNEYKIKCKYCLKDFRNMEEGCIKKIDFDIYFICKECDSLQKNDAECLENG